MDTMSLYALIWAINICTECRRREEFNRLAELITFIVRESEKRFSKRQVKLIIHAMKLSAQWHSPYYRHDGWTPYVIHPLEVVETLFLLGIYDFDLTVAALLHDVVEDEKDRKKRWKKRLMIKRIFGSVACGVVELMTKAPSTRPWDRKLFFPRLRGARKIHEAWRAQVGKLVDAEVNGRTYNVFAPEKQRSKVEENDKEYPPVAKRLEANLHTLVRAGKLPYEQFWNLSDLLLGRLMTTLMPYRT